jgi:hypothetical protein
MSGLNGAHNKQISILKWSWEKKRKRVPSSEKLGGHYAPSLLLRNKNTNLHIKSSKNSSSFQKERRDPL